MMPDELASRFARRTQRYRSYRYRYLVRLQTGFVGALALLIGVFHLPLQAPDVREIQPAEQIIVTLDEVIPTRQEIELPPPRPQIPIVVADDEILEADDLIIDALLDIDEPLAMGPPPPVDEPEEEEEEDEIFRVVEDMPEIIGGMKQLLQDITYPQLAIRAGLEGIVVVKVVIDKEGIPSQPTVVKSVAESLDEAATLAVMKQRFTPALQRKRPVRVSMNIPVTFRID